MNASKLLILIIVLQAMILLGQWTGSGPVSAAGAQSGPPDPGAQRAQILEELRNLNAKVAGLIERVDSGKIQVKLELPDQKK